MRGRSCRNVIVAAVLGVSMLLSACGSDPAPVAPAPNLATIPGGGRNYSFGADDLSRSQFPDPCRLLPTSSAETLLGVPVTSTHILNSCAWAPKVASKSVLTVTIQHIGAGAEAAYTASRQHNTSHHPTSVHGIGQAANVYRLSHDRVTRLEVRTKRVFFFVSVRSALSQARDDDMVRRIAERVAQLVVAQVNG